MNERNARAIAVKLAEYLNDPDGDYIDVSASTTDSGDPFDDSQLGPLAKWLASRGVLVPSALTDEEVYSFNGSPLAMRSSRSRTNR